MKEILWKGQILKEENKILESSDTSLVMLYTNQAQVFRKMDNVSH